MPRWDTKKLTPVAPKRKVASLKPTTGKPTAGKLAVPKTNRAQYKVEKPQMLQVGDVHIDPSTVVAIESVSALSCNILTDKFRVTAAVPHAAARQAIDTRTALTTWATPDEIARHRLEMCQRVSQIEAEFERDSGDDKPEAETGPILQ